jgi:hypothetical protein
LFCYSYCCLTMIRWNLPTWIGCFSSHTRQVYPK